MRSAAVLSVLLVVAVRAPDPPTFRPQEIRQQFGVGYAVSVADVNGDRKPDIAAISGTQLVWFENPTWKEHVALDARTPKDNVCFAPYDIDRDGRMDFAVGASWKPTNTKEGGTLHWTGRTSGAIRAPGEGGEDTAAWDLTNVTEEPTLHRIRWADVDGDGRKELIVTPLHGRGTSGPQWDGAGARVMALRAPANPRQDAWPMEVVDDSLHILHNFLVTNFDRDKRDELLTASREGVHLLDRDAGGKWSRTRIAEGAPGEIAIGTIGGQRWLATIEPWHGTSIVLYREQPGLWSRHVLDDQLTGGHAIAWADMDGDGDDEVVAGWRDKPSPGVAVYRVDSRGQRLSKTLVDDGGMATEDLAVADLNADGRPDIVASGRATANIKIYWNQR